MLIAVKDIQFFDKARGEHVTIAATETCDEIPEPNLGIYLAQGLVRDTAAPSDDELQEEPAPVDPPEAAGGPADGSAAGAATGSPEATKKKATKKKATKKKATKKARRS